MLLDRLRGDTELPRHWVYVATMDYLFLDSIPRSVNSFRQFDAYELASVRISGNGMTSDVFKLFRQ